MAIGKCDNKGCDTVLDGEVYAVGDESYPAGRCCSVECRSEFINQLDAKTGYQQRNTFKTVV